MGFRLANEYDVALLYAWRKQAEQTGETAGFWEGQPTTVLAHAKWFAERRTNPLIRILIWETEPGHPTGMVRIDSNGEITYHTTHQNTALGMLTAILPQAERYGGRLKATIDQADTERSEALLAAGFQQHPAVFLTYKP